MNYPDSVHFLYALGNEIKTAKLGLERIRTVLDALGHPEDGYPIVHVAGTNGKGSVCAMIESGLRVAGSRTGLFTSPHLAEPTERISIDGSPITAEEFTEAFNRVHRSVEELLAAGRLDFHTTYFETVTAMALLVFAEHACDRVVLEVGLGGRLDATNVVTPELCVITPVDFDHEAWLGTAIESIAREKAGILKPGIQAVFSRQRPEAARVLLDRAAELAVPVTHTADWAVSNLELTPRSSRFHLTGAAHLEIQCPLAGEHQVENAVTAAAALHRLGVAPGTIQSGIAATRWPGRLEHVAEHPETILDGAHNPAGARALAAYIDRFYSGRPVCLVYGSMRDKAIEEIAGILFSKASRVILTAPRQPRAMEPGALCRIAGHPGAETAPTVGEALELARRNFRDGVVFVTGSLFLVAEARALL